MENGHVYRYTDIELLPRRINFIGPCVIRPSGESSEVLFMPNSVIESTQFCPVSGAERSCYRLILTGVLLNGGKASVVLTGIYPDFLVRVPEVEDVEKWTAEVEAHLNGIALAACEKVSRMPFNYFHEQEASYLKLSFYNTSERSSAIKVLEAAGLELANDDRSCYFRKVAREYHIRLCDWGLISQHQLAPRDLFMKSESVPTVMLCRVEDYSCPDLMNMKGVLWSAKELMNDRSLLCAWDIETFSHVPTGAVPSYKNVLEGWRGRGVNNPDSVREEPHWRDVIFMLSCSFHWYYEERALLTVCITDMPTPPRDDCVIIQCDNQRQIVLAWARLLERMAPEFVTGFNDAQYDWRFVIKVLKIHEAYNYRGAPMELFTKFKRYTSMLASTPFNLSRYYPNKKIEHIKLEAGHNTRSKFLDIPGIICMDTRTIFRQLYPTAEKSSLNYFLSENKLGGKEDMPYQVMHRTYRLCWFLKKHYSTSRFEELVARVEADISALGGDLVLFSGARFYDVDGLRLSEIRELLMGCTLVVKYCNVDARRCQELLKIRNVIADRREMANLSFTCMYDAIYRANGVKVRNMMAEEGCKPEWNYAFPMMGVTKESGKRYPGAFVVDPDKGLNRDEQEIKEARRAADPQAPECNDNSGGSDRPCVALDAASLYPSIIRAYNLSREKILDPARAAELRRALEGKKDRWGHPYRFLEVEFPYGYKEQAEEDKQRVSGTIVQHTLVTVNGKETYQGMGLAPFVLDGLAAKRAVLKKKMDSYGAPREFLGNVFKSVPLAALRGMATDEQQARVLAVLEERVAAHREKLERTGKAFYREELKALEEMRSWLGQHRGERIEALYEELCFQFNYFNSKQLALKTYMNTFYGEFGNSLSSFFVVQLAGAVTVMGQRIIKTAKKMVEGEGYKVKYGDTDSLYIVPPHSCFAAVDARFQAQQISKVAYWEEMIETTMEAADKLKARVNAMLREFSGTGFLKMSYEEVLFPYLFVGRKKYCGIKHERIANLRACLPGRTVDEFAADKTLFVRGLELRKRGSSQLLKIICYEVLREAFSIESHKTLKDIVVDKLRELHTREWDVSVFVKSAKYRDPGIDPITGKPKRGNVSMLLFQKRMRKLEREKPELGIREEEKGERVDFIIAQKYGFTYGLRGQKDKLPTGEKYEYPSSLQNAAYAKYLGAPLQVDRDYYVTNEIAGQLARLIVYHPSFAHFYHELERTGEDDDEALKAADKAAHGEAKKELCRLYREGFAVLEDGRGRYYKGVFKEIGREFHDEVEAQCGEAGKVLKIVETLATGTVIDYGGAAHYKDAYWTHKIKALLLEKARKKGEKLAKVNLPLIKKDEVFATYLFYCNGPQCQYQLRKKLAREEEIEINRGMEQALGDFQRVCLVGRSILQDRIEARYEEDGEARYEEEGEGAEGTAGRLELEEHDIEAVVRMDAIFRRLVGWNCFVKENELYKEELTQLKSSLITGLTQFTPSERQTLKEELRAWLRKKEGAQ